jgi:F0F1-type ATP synthase membrane subunit b/b'
MYFFNFIIKLLMSNSGSLFIGLMIIIFGYYGWLLWNINERLKDFLQYREQYEYCIKEFDNKIDELEENMEKGKSDIIDEIKESAAEIKEIMKILMNHRSRSIKRKTDHNHN